MKKLTVIEIEHIAFNLAREHYTFNEPIPDFTTRFPNVLESCLAVPFQTYGGKDLYPALVKKAAILFYLMVKNHPFQNGNKRIGMTTLMCLLHKNGKWIAVEHEKLYAFAMFAAASPADAKEEVINYIEKFIKKYLIDSSI